MIRASVISFFFLAQMVFGALIGPSIVFFLMFGQWGLVIFLYVTLTSVTTYAFWMQKELRSPKRKFSAKMLQFGIVATFFLSMVVSAILVASPLGAKLQTIMGNLLPWADKMLA